MTNYNFLPIVISRAASLDDGDLCLGGARMMESRVCIVGRCSDRP